MEIVVLVKALVMGKESLMPNVMMAKKEVIQNVKVEIVNHL